MLALVLLPRMPLPLCALARARRGASDMNAHTTLTASPTQTGGDLGGDDSMDAYFERRRRKEFGLDNKLQTQRRIHRPTPAEFVKIDTPPTDNEVRDNTRCLADEKCLTQPLYRLFACRLCVCCACAGRRWVRAQGVNKLRPYQVEGVNWMVFNWHNGRNSILADEMGLGKTVQTLQFLKSLRTRQNVRAPFLVIAPLSTLPHWQRESISWTQFNTVVYHGSADSRETIRDFEFWAHDGTGAYRTKKFNIDVLITTCVHRVELFVCAPGARA